MEEMESRPLRAVGKFRGFDPPKKGMVFQQPPVAQESRLMIFSKMDDLIRPKAPLSLLVSFFLK